MSHPRMHPTKNHWRLSSALGLLKCSAADTLKNKSERVEGEKPHKSGATSMGFAWEKAFEMGILMD